MENYIVNKKYWFNYLFYISVSVLVISLLKLESLEYFYIKYLFTFRPFYILLCILFTALEGLMYFNIIEFFIQSRYFLIVRLGNNLYYKKLINRFFIHSFFFIGMNCLLDLILFNKMTMLFILNILLNYAACILLRIYLFKTNDFDNSYVVFVALLFTLKLLFGVFL